MKIFSQAGKELMTGIIPGNISTLVKTQLSSGLYFLVMEMNGKTMKMKLLIQR